MLCLDSTLLAVLNVPPFASDDNDAFGDDDDDDDVGFGYANGDVGGDDDLLETMMTPLTPSP